MESREQRGSCVAYQNITTIGTTSTITVAVEVSASALTKGLAEASRPGKSHIC
jgi:hypothetical protein